jgi:hypothetical protein
MLKSLAFVFFAALRGMPACFGPTGLGTAEWGRTQTRWNLAIAPPSVLLVEELCPESQKTRVVIFIADGAPIFRWPGFFQAAVCRGLSRRTVRLTSGSQQSKSILDEDPRKKSQAKWHEASQKAANHCQPLPLFARWGHSLKRLKPKYDLALRSCKPRLLPCTSGIALIPSRAQHRLAGAEPGGTWLSRLCGTVQEEGTVRVG